MMHMVVLWWNDQYQNHYGYHQLKWPWKVSVICKYISEKVKKKEVSDIVYHVWVCRGRLTSDLFSIGSNCPRAPLAIMHMAQFWFWFKFLDPWRPLALTKWLAPSDWVMVLFTLYINYLAINYVTMTIGYKWEILCLWNKCDYTTKRF